MNRETRVPPSIERKRKYQVNVIVPEDLWNRFQLIATYLKEKRGIRSKAGALTWIIRQALGPLFDNLINTLTGTPQQISITQNINQSITQHNIQVIQNKLTIHKSFIESYQRRQEVFSRARRIVREIENLVSEVNENPSVKKQLLELYQQGVQLYQDLVTIQTTSDEESLVQHALNLQTLLDRSLDKAMKALKEAELIEIHGR